MMMVVVTMQVRQSDRFDSSGAVFHEFAHAQSAEPTGTYSFAVQHKIKSDGNLAKILHRHSKACVVDQIPTAAAGVIKIRSHEVDVEVK